MTNTFQLRRALIYLFLGPLAVFIGYLISEPDVVNLGILMALVFIGMLPLMMKWHHLLLVILWNATLVAFFVPGQPDLWMIFTLLSIGFSLWKRTMQGEKRLYFV